MLAMKKPSTIIIVFIPIVLFVVAVIIFITNRFVPYLRPHIATDSYGEVLHWAVGCCSVPMDDIGFDFL